MDDKNDFQDSEYKNESEMGFEDLNDNELQRDHYTDGVTGSKPGFSVDGVLGKLKTGWKRLIVPLGIGGAILVVYLLISVSSQRKSSTLEQKKLSAQENAAFSIKQEQSVLSVNDSVGMERHKLSSEVYDERLNELGVNLQHAIDSIGSQMSKNNSRVIELVNSIEQCRSEVAEISQNISALAEGIRQLWANMESLKKENKPKPKAAQPQAKVGYAILAVVPGRAWLKSEHGKTITVKVGDTLGGYGEIKAISARKGMVLMEDGSVIQHEFNGS